MPSLRSPLLLSLVLVWLTGCGPTPSPSATGALRLAVAAPLSESGGPARVTVSVAGTSVPSTELVLTDGAWRGLLEHLPTHARHTLHVQAFDADNTLLAEGRAESVPVQADTTGLAVLMLRGLSQRPPVFNQPPLIDSLLMDTSLVAPGGSVFLTAQAHDPDPGDSVSYAWEAASGVFSAPDAASTTWTASSFQAPESLWFTVSDNRGAAFTVELSVDVSAGQGARDVRVGFNHAPRVAGLTSSQSRLDMGQTTSLSVTATDLEGDALGYAWSATCAGTFSAPTSASTTFTPSARPSAACNNCQLSVQVKDGRGGQNTGGVALCVSKDAVAHAPPRFTLAYQSSPTARAGQQLGFDVEASDPEGAALTFAWTTGAGAIDSSSSSATGSHAVWTAPTCVRPGRSPGVTATVTNAWGVSVTKDFTVKGLAACVPERWTFTGAMKTARRAHGAVRLLDGRVLVMGGYNDNVLASAELYDPATGTWSPTGAMNLPRATHTATLLANGKVLAVGGGNNGNTSLATAEVYDPATGTWSLTGAMSAGCFRHTATRLADGRVLITGGAGSSSMKTAQVYDPATDTWSLTGPLSIGRADLRSALLADGRVLILGGSGEGQASPVAEVYDPASGTFSPTGAMSSPRDWAQATLLPDGQVLASGGFDSAGSKYLLTADRYNPATGLWSATGSMKTRRFGHTSTLLPKGKVLVAGGYNSTPLFLALAEVYDPATGTWTSTGSMGTPRDLHTATPLLDGRVLVTGGEENNNAILATAEVYEPAP